MSIRCPICDEEFGGNLNLVDHFLLAHASEAERWEISEEQTTVTENDLEKTKYSNLFRNACDICGDIKSSPRKLANHILSHLGTMPYFCFPCSFSCISKLRLQQHIYNHATHKSDNQRYWLFTKSNLHECESCDKNFSTWIDLVFHYSNHIIKMPYKCQECWLYFSDMKDFIIHSHLHKRTTVCEMCDIFFDSRPRLLDHVLEHNKSKMFRKFRHIAWNDGLSSIRNPFSVLRADYFGNSFHRVFFDPNCAENDDDSLIHCDLMVNLNKTRAIEEPEYEDREDVTHLCEIIFKEFSDNDSCMTEFNNIFNQHVKRTSSHGQIQLDKLPIVPKNTDCVQNLLKKENASCDNSDLQNSVAKLNNAKSDKNNSKSIVKTRFKNRTNYSTQLKVKNLSIVLEKLPKYVCDMKSFRKYNEIKQLRTRNIRKNKTNCCYESVNGIALSKLDTKDKKPIVKNNSSLTFNSNSFKSTKKRKLSYFEKRKLISIRTHDSVENKRILRSGKVVNIREAKGKEPELGEEYKGKEFKDVKKSQNFSFPKRDPTSKHVGKINDKNTVLTDKVSICNMLENTETCLESNLKLSKSVKKPVNNIKNICIINGSSKKDESKKKRKTNLKYIEKILGNKRIINNIVIGNREKLSLFKKLTSITNVNNSIAENPCADNNISSELNAPLCNKSNYSEVIKNFKSSYWTRRNAEKSISIYFDNSNNNRTPEIFSELCKINHDHNYQANGVFNNEQLYATSSNHHDRTKIKKEMNKKLSGVQKHTANHQKRDLLNRNQNMFIKKKRLRNICFKPNLQRASMKTLISKAKSQKLSINLVRLPSYIYEKYLKQKPIMLSSVSPIISSVESLPIVPTALTVKNVHSLLDHSYSDSLPAILDDHNYCKLHHDDSDSDSTLSSYSCTL